ncbi:hypothetical protein OAM01_00475 [bacterium]|nr:hypothetical protein [bacterium]
MKPSRILTTFAGALCLGGVFFCHPLFAQPIESSAKLLPVIQESMAEVGFGHLVHQITGHAVIPSDQVDPWQKEALAVVSKAAVEVMKSMNLETSPTRKRGRINEVSRDFEDALRLVLDDQKDWTCDIPLNASGKQQRAGYPDLVLLHSPTGRRVYLDPKVYGELQRASSLRTFYYEPKSATTKILHDAMHLLIGFEHDGAGGGKWRFVNWSIIDMSQVKVRLKLEFQTSNRELYKSQHTISKSEN